MWLRLWGAGPRYLRGHYAKQRRDLMLAAPRGNAKLAADEVRLRHQTQEIEEGNVGDLWLQSPSV